MVAFLLAARVIGVGLEAVDGRNLQFRFSWILFIVPTARPFLGLNIMIMSIMFVNLWARVFPLAWRTGESGLLASRASRANPMIKRRTLLLTALVSIVGTLTSSALSNAGSLREIRIDYATYNPLSLVLKEQHVLEDAFARDGIAIRWVQTLGSNKALEFLNAEAIDFGSTAGSAALVGRVNGNPIKAIYVYSAPEWTALVTRKDSEITTIADLKGKRIAVTRGTDPHIFLVRALQEAGLTQKDVKLVLLQHGDGRVALDRGDVDAWAGLDPMMATAEIENGDRLFYRNPAANTFGILNVRESFAKDHPEIVRKVLAAYEVARKWAITHPDDFKKIVVEATKLAPAVIDRQIDARTDLSQSAIGEPQRRSILAAGLALRDAGVLPPETNVEAALASLIDTQYLGAPASQ
jgi:sulfonate transport system substrate-binding protein